MFGINKLNPNIFGYKTNERLSHCLAVKFVVFSFFMVLGRVSAFYQDNYESKGNKRVQ